MLYALAALFLVVALVSIRQDRRRFRNAVLLGLAVASLIIALLGDIDRLPLDVAGIVVFFVLLIPLITVLVLAVFLLANGVTMIRRESRSLGNLLSFLTGLGLLALVVLLIAAEYTQHPGIGAVAVSALAAVAYVSFLFCCYLGYAFLYGRLRVRSGVDFVVVLGSRIINGRIPPLLASRLDKAIALYRNERDQGGKPIVITSGGQGRDENQPESHAMADYLVAHGVPDGEVLREDRSATTAQNITFSRELMQQHRPGYRCVVVTNNFHAFRAAILARTAKVNGQVVGAPTALYYWPSATIREFTAILMEHRLVNFGVTGLLALTGFLAALP
ncbi:YdcF family protein [Amycolatopsis sp. CM201R]|nr:YdcF family protein [Amycolatopsis sp. 505]MDS0145521.1 YdcF family protein [Amycolatopsis sp. CM201R]